MGKIGKTLKNLLYAGTFAAASFLPSCEKDEPPIEPPKEAIEQSAMLNNDIEIKYSASLSNVDKAELKVNRDGVLISTKEINDVNQSGADYQNTFTYAKDGTTKGNYEFVLKSDNLEKRNSVSVPNYKPTGNFTDLSLDLDEDSEISITLPAPSDKNPEDNPVSYVNAKSLDGKTSLTLNGNNLNIKSFSSTGHYEFELEFGSAAGGLEKKILLGEIIGVVKPKIEIDPFTYIYNPNAVINTLTNKTARDNLIQTKLDGDWVYTIPQSDRWACGNSAMQEIINSNYFGENMHTNSGDFTDGDLLYNGNKSRELELIYQNHGTLADMGKMELPMGLVTLVDTSHYRGYFGHGMNWVASGTFLTKLEDITFVEPQQHRIVKPGEALLPEDCDLILLSYYYVVKENNYLELAHLVKFRLEKGVGTLIWENNDPRYNIKKER